MIGQMLFKHGDVLVVTLLEICPESLALHAGGGISGISVVAPNRIH